MDNLNITPSESRLHIEGFPDAVKVIEGPLSLQIADLSLHKIDLEFAQNINSLC